MRAGSGAPQRRAPAPTSILGTAPHLTAPIESGSGYDGHSCALEREWSAVPVEAVDLAKPGVNEPVADLGEGEDANGHLCPPHPAPSHDVPGGRDPAGVRVEGVPIQHQVRAQLVRVAA